MLLAGGISIGSSCVETCPILISILDFSQPPTQQPGGGTEATDEQMTADDAGCRSAPFRRSAARRLAAGQEQWIAAINEY